MGAEMANQETWLATGVSGSGRIELLEEMRDEARRRGVSTEVHDVGDLIRKACKKHKIPITDERVLDCDRSQLRLLRLAALDQVELAVLKHPEVQLHLVGIHATFRWKGRLIPGISYANLLGLRPFGLMNVVDNVKDIFYRNQKNPKWDSDSAPDLETTQDWMIEEEFVTEVLAEVLNVPFFLIARQHNIQNLTDLLLTRKKKIYLSYPITAVKDDNPELLEKVQGPLLERLQSLFVVFNPMDVEDMPLTYNGAQAEEPVLLETLTHNAIDKIKRRTVERDFQFIDQADAIVVFYLTDKLSPGVLAEILYAHRNQKPVFVVFSGSVSPFLEEAATEIFKTPDSLMTRLEEFAKSKRHVD